MIDGFKNIHECWDELFPREQEKILHSIISKVILDTDQITININPSITKEVDAIPESRTVPLKINKRGGFCTIIESKFSQQPQSEDVHNRILKALLKADKWKRSIEQGEYTGIEELIKRQDLNRTYARKMFRLNFLCPDIVNQILDNSLPRYITLHDLIYKPLPDLWEQQKEALGL